MVKFAQCCNPLPGDDIIGFITRGHGVSIHKKDCVNVLSSMKDPSQYGSHYACVEIKVPQNISVEAKQKLREFGRLCGEEDLLS